MKRLIKKADMLVGEVLTESQCSLHLFDTQSKSGVLARSVGGGAL